MNTDGRRRAPPHARARRESGLEPLGDLDVRTEPDRDRVPGVDRVHVVDGQLEARQDEQVVEAERALVLDLDRGEVLLVPLRPDAVDRRWDAGARHEAR